MLGGGGGHNFDVFEFTCYSKKKPVQNSLFFSRSLIQILVQFHECVGAGNG